VDPSALQVTLFVTNALDELGIPYVIGGSMASIIHGMLRTTLDVDIVADIQSEQAAPFVAILQGAFYADEQMIQQAVRHRGSFNLIHLGTAFKVDIFIPRGRPFDQQQLERRISEPVGGDTSQQIWVLSAEDLVLAKLDWFRLGGEVSERQWRDVLGVLKTQLSDLDIDYLNEWAKRLRVADLMNRAIEEMSSTN